jgi:hypothetical protein
MTFVALVVMLLVVLVVVALVRQSRRDVERDPLTGDAAAWAGQHTPVAKLHRRLAEAVAALPTADDPNLLEARMAIEQLARAVDDQLVTVARLPERVQDEPLAQATAAVEAVEAGVARVAANELGAHGAAAVEAALHQLEERMALLEQARKELGEAEGGSGGTSSP